MATHIFKFSATAPSSLVRWLTIKANVLSVYNGKKHDINNLDVEDYIWAKIKECNTECESSFYRPIVNFLSVAHNKLNPHVDQAELEFSHIHAQTCSIILPEDLECILRQLQALQADTLTRKADLTLVLKEQIALAQRKGLQNIAHITSVVPDATTPYLTDADIASLKKDFRHYFLEHREAIREEWREYVKSMSYRGMFLEVGGSCVWSMLYVMAYTALIELFTQGCIAKGMNSKKAQWYAQAPILLITVYTSLASEAYYFLAFSLLMSTICAGLKLSGKTTRFLCSVTTTMGQMIRYFPFDILGVFHLVLSLIAAVTSALIMPMMIGLTKSAANHAIACSKTAVTYFWAQPANAIAAAPNGAQALVDRSPQEAAAKLKLA
jgi:hypothetical protein